MSETDRLLDSGGLVFIKRASDLYGKRFDPCANQPKRIKLDLDLRKSPYPVMRLADVVDFGNQTVKEIPESWCPYIGLENVDGITGSHVASTEKESISTATLFKEGEILFPKLRPYLNKTHLARFHGICSTEFHVLRPTKVEAAYLTVVLRSSHIAGLTALLMTGNTLPRLQTQDIKELPIPIPPTSVQDRVASIWQAALEKQSAGNTEARSFLASIDDIMFSELGIPRVSAPKNELGCRIYKSSFSALTGRRLDTNYAMQMKHFLARLKGGTSPLCKLNDFVETVQYGISERATADEVGVPMLRMLNMQDGEWRLDDMKYIAMSDKEKDPFLLTKGDFLFNRTNSKELVGKCNVFDLAGEYVFASYLIRVSLRSDAGLLPEFVVAYLTSSLGRLQIDAVSRQIAGMRNINAEEVRELLIPTPDRRTQEQICKRVASIRIKARFLREQANMELQSAKREIESIILGKTV